MTAKPILDKAPDGNTGQRCVPKDDDRARNHSILKREVFELIKIKRAVWANRSLFFHFFSKRPNVFFCPADI